MSQIKSLLLSALLYSLSLFADYEDRLEEIRAVYFPINLESLGVQNWKEPTFQDYLSIQDYIDQRMVRIYTTKPQFPFFENGHVSYRINRGKLVLKDRPEPTFNVIYFNNNPDDKSKCVICHASYSVFEDRDYERGLYFLIEALKATHFDGHLIYRIGGWPNLKKERLKFADVPYAFKPFLFEEVRDLGYKKALWLDTCAIPIKSLDPLFQWIDQNGCCFFDVFCWPMGAAELLNKRWIMKSLGLSGRTRYQHVLSQVVGLDFENQNGSRLLDAWIGAAEKKIPFLESDQTAFGFLVCELNLLRAGRLPPEYYLEGVRHHFINPKEAPKAIIYHQYDFIHPGMSLPDDFFKNY